MKSLGIAIGVLVFANAFSFAAAAIEKQKQKMRIGLITASFPWTFGPYQSQMHKLSLLLSDVKDSDEIEYDIFWMIYAESAPPKGLYKSYEEMKPYIQNVFPPPADFPMDHLTFTGSIKDGMMSATTFNKLKKEYDLDCLITLMDITKVHPTEPFNIPVLAWVPLHSETVSSATPDYWILRNYHGIASLAPSSANAINDAVGKEIKLTNEAEATRRTMDALKDLIGSVEVDFIPHMFDRQALSASADVGLNMLKDHSVNEADNKLANMPLINRGQESILEAGHSRSLFGKETNDDFIVLMQGGNYDEADRKGWDTSLQAFVRFYNSLDDPSGVHLLIHSMESYLVASDTNMHSDAPGSILPKGVSLKFVLHEHGLPSNAYTIDIAKHAPEVVAAYKKRADVCLHSSKVEGFGMNVLECQIVGTPVITTNYTAMADYTKLGRSVPHRQTIRSPQDLYEMALPDVIGIADALGELYEEYQAMKQGEKEALTRREVEVLRFNDWFDKTCSPEVVGEKFKALLLRTRLEFNERQKGKETLYKSNNPPTSGAFEIASGYHPTIVDWDAPWTLLAPEGMKIVQPKELHTRAWNAWMSRLNSNGDTHSVIFIPAKYDDGTDVPFMNNAGEFHEDIPILVDTYMMTAIQANMSRRKSLVLMSIQNSGQPTVMKEGMVIIERNKDSGASSSQSLNNEL